MPRYGNAASPVDLRSAVRQHEWRSGAGVLLGRHHRPLQSLGALGRRAQPRLHVQRQACRCATGCAATESQSCARGQRAQGRRPRSDHCPACRWREGGHIWAERYDRDLNDIFALQDEISQAIVAALKLKLLPEEKKAIEQRGTTNPEAYKPPAAACRHPRRSNA